MAYTQEITLNSTATPQGNRKIQGNAAKGVSRTYKYKKNARPSRDIELIKDHILEVVADHDGVIKAAKFMDGARQLKRWLKCYSLGTIMTAFRRLIDGSVLELNRAERRYEYPPMIA